MSVTWKQVVVGPHGVEGQLGLRLDQGISLAALYEYHLDIGFDTGFDAYGGGGPVIGVYYIGRENAVFGAGIAAIVGIEYTFRLAPIAVGVDYQPVLGYKSSYIQAGVNLRYTFSSR